MAFSFDTHQSTDEAGYAEVPEKYQKLYEKSGDKFVISEGAKALVGEYISVSKNLAKSKVDLSTANGESAGRRKMIDKVVDALKATGAEIADDANLEEVIPTVIADIGDKVKTGATVKVDMDKIKTAADARVAAAKTEAQKDVTAMQEALFIHIGEGAVKDAFAKHKGDPELLLPHAIKSVKVVKDATDPKKYVTQIVDAEGALRTNASGNPMTPEDLVLEMKGHASYAKGFASEVKGGGGTQSRTGRTEVPKVPGRTEGQGEKSEVDQIKSGLVNLRVA